MLALYFRLFSLLNPDLLVRVGLPERAEQPLALGQPLAQPQPLDPLVPALRR